MQDLDQVDDNEGMNEYIAYLTSGERGQWYSTPVAATSPDDARKRADGLRPGWRCYAVQLTLAEA
jgi:hypothetical protein